MTQLPDYTAAFEIGFQRRETEADRWHKNPLRMPDGSDRWFWHASSLDKCARENILKRAGLAHDPTTLDGSMAMEVGHMFHGLAEDFLTTDEGQEALGGNVEVVAVEKGGFHSTLPLAARPDHIILLNGKPVIGDLKSEAGAAVKMRTADAKSVGAFDNARPGHKVQVTAGALIAEDPHLWRYDETGMLLQRTTPMYQGQARLGIILYISRQIGKNKWDFTVETFEITDEMRADVQRRLQNLEAMWAAYEHSLSTPTVNLPLRLQPEMRFGKLVANWNCRPRAKDDSRGMYCSARSACMTLPPLPLEPYHETSS